VVCYKIARLEYTDEKALATSLLRIPLPCPGRNSCPSLKSCPGHSLNSCPVHVRNSLPNFLRRARLNIGPSSRLPSHCPGH
jgi:hypothetical protein